MGTSVATRAVAKLFGTAHGYPVLTPIFAKSPTVSGSTVSPAKISCRVVLTNLRVCFLKPN
jgi:hypothetical protein